MSLHPPPCDVIPEQTIQVARAAFPKGNPYMRMRDALGPIYTNPTICRALFAHRTTSGGPSPARAHHHDAICRRALGRAGGGCGAGAD